MISAAGHGPRQLRQGAEDEAAKQQLLADRRDDGGQRAHREDAERAGVAADLLDELLLLAAGVKQREVDVGDDDEGDRAGDQDSHGAPGRGRRDEPELAGMNRSDLGREEDRGADEAEVLDHGRDVGRGRAETAAARDTALHQQDREDTADHAGEQAADQGDRAIPRRPALLARVAHAVEPTASAICGEVHPRSRGGAPART